MVMDDHNNAAADADDDDDDDDVCADNTIAIAVSTVIGAVALVALICAFQFIRSNPVFITFIRYYRIIK